MLRLLVAGFVLASLSFPAHFCHSQAADPEITMAGIQVIRQTAGSEDSRITPFNSFRGGTKLALMVRATKSSIIDIDLDSSELTAFVDSNKQNLIVENETASFGFSQQGFGQLTSISDDGKAGLVTISGDGVPSKGASKVGAMGTLTVVTGSQTEAIRSQPTELTRGVSVAVGEIKMKVKSLGSPSFGDAAQEITFETKDKAITTLAGVKFYDADGTEIESSSGGSGSMGFNGNYTYGQSYRLKKELSGETVIEFLVWTDLEEKKVPFKMTVGLGG